MAISDVDPQQLRALDEALASWDGPRDDFKINARDAALMGFRAGHERGWSDRDRRDAEPPNGAVVLLFRPEDAERTMVFRRRDEWAELGNLGEDERWYILDPPGDYSKPITWLELRMSGKVTELIEGVRIWER